MNKQQIIDRLDPSKKQCALCCRFQFKSYMKELVGKEKQVFICLDHMRCKGSFANKYGFSKHAFSRKLEKIKSIIGYWKIDTGSTY